MKIMDFGKLIENPENFKKLPPFKTSRILPP